VFGKRKLPEQLGFHACAVSTHPDELVLEPPCPLKKSWIRLYISMTPNKNNLWRPVGTKQRERLFWFK